MMKKRLMISGMSCGQCAKRITMALNSVCGVNETVVSVSTQSAIVDLAHPVDRKAFDEALKSTGMGYAIQEVFDA